MISSGEIEKKINSFYGVEEIINAMKAYAGVTVRKTEEVVANIRAYEENVICAMTDVIAHHPEFAPEGGEGGKSIIAAFGSSQGLCGPFNEKMADEVSNVVTGNDALFVIGKRLRSSLELKRIKPYGFIESTVSVNGIATALRETISGIMELYRKEEFYNLTFIFTAVSDNKAEIKVEPVLPPSIGRVCPLRPERPAPITYMEPAAIFDSLLEEFLYISLYRCLMESLRSENWYRLRSMEGASDSIRRKISDLSSQQKYARQEEVTEEMLEILGSGMFYG